MIGRTKFVTASATIRRALAWLANQLGGSASAQTVYPGLSDPPRHIGSVTTPAPVVALIDIGNVCPRKAEQDHVDALNLIGLLIRDACPRPNSARVAVEVECRLYGGFRDIDGHATERRAWLTRHLHELRGLQGGVRVLPTLVEHIAVAPDAMLIGTYANQSQKMVDIMIAEDLGAFARSGLFASIILVSDDDDFVPAVLSAGRSTPASIRWVRKRTTGRNDRYFSRSTELVTDSRWTA